jgi:hypothetical protein
MELGQAPANDPILSRSSIELISTALPTIKYTAKFTNDFLKIPLELDPDVLLSLSYIKLFMDAKTHVSAAFVFLQAKKSAVLDDIEDPNAVYAQIEHVIDYVRNSI